VFIVKHISTVELNVLTTYMTMQVPLAIATAKRGCLALKCARTQFLYYVTMSSLFANLQSSASAMKAVRTAGIGCFVRHQHTLGGGPSS